MKLNRTRQKSPWPASTDLLSICETKGPSTRARKARAFPHEHEKSSRAREIITSTRNHHEQEKSSRAREIITSTRNHLKELFATDRTLISNRRILLPTWLISCRFSKLYSLVWTLQRALLVNSDHCSASFARSCGRDLKHTQAMPAVRRNRCPYTEVECLASSIMKYTINGREAGSSKIIYVSKEN